MINRARCLLEGTSQNSFEKKLDHYGFREVIINCFRFHLTDRKQKVLIDGFESESKILPHGVPHGSVLGPVLFFIYINDFT